VGIFSKIFGKAKESAETAKESYTAGAASTSAKSDTCSRENQRMQFIQNQIAEHNAMVNNIPLFKCKVSDVPAKKLTVDRLNDISYSNITKKTPRDKLGNFVAIDTETTGLSASTCEIIDIAAIRFRDFMPAQKISMLLSPKKGLSEDAMLINHITLDMVEGRPTFGQVAESLLSFIGNDNIVGHNLEFDLKFIVKGGADVTAQKRKYYDTLDIAQRTLKKVRKKWDKDLESFEEDYDSDYDVEDYKLGTLCDYYGIINTESHRAEGDAIAAGELLRHLADDRL
jgi:DNA polymerase III, epsilon subunit and related 3''-5'' exonucleases